MKLDNHIAKRFLTDDMLIMEMLGDSFLGIPLESYTENSEVMAMAQVLYPIKQKAYYCTNTVLDMLSMLKASRKDGRYDWSVFNGVPDGKSTYIFPNNSLLRVFINDEIIHMTYLHMKVSSLSENYGQLKWTMFYVDKKTGEKCDFFTHDDVREIEEFVYKLLCFIHLTENDEVVLKPKEKTGTKKSGKIINTLNLPLTIITSRWNTTVIRTEGFSVKGHFAIRWSGEGRLIPKLVFIQPFEKNGYVRTAKSKEQ
jgi:hypothetical protein